MPMSTVLLFVWGTFQDLKEFRGRPVEVVRRWILTKYRQSGAGLATNVDEEQMDQTSDLLAGGPVKGFMVKLKALTEQKA